MIYLVYAHPYPSKSRASRALVDAVRDLPDLEICSLYDRYPDFDIDVAREQAALRRAALVVWLHPLFWYSVPALLKHWFDTVLSYGWAYGEGTPALGAKDCLWVATTGGAPASYSAIGIHRRPFDEFVSPIEETARFCGMTWLTPFIVHGAAEIDGPALAARAAELRARLLAWRAEHDRSTGRAP